MNSKADLSCTPCKLDHNVFVPPKPFALWTVDLNGVLKSFECSEPEMFSSDPQNLIESSLVAPDEETSFLSRNLKRALQGESCDAVIEFLGLDLETWFRPLKNQYQVIVGVSGVSYPIEHSIDDSTEQSGPLLKTGELYNVLNHLSNVGIFICNGSGEIKFANDYFWSCFSQELQETVLSNQTDVPKIIWMDLFQDENKQALEQSCHRLASQGVFRRELQIISPRSSVEWVLVQLGSSDQSKWIGTVVDISAVKQAESMFGLQRIELEKAVQVRTIELVERNTQLLLEVEKRKETAKELQLSRDYMEAIIRNAVDIILHLDRDGRILFMNRSVTGYDTNKILGTSLYEWVEPGHEDILENALKKVLVYEEHVSIEVPIILITGEFALYSTRWGPIYNQGKVIGTTIVARNITRDRELEEEAKGRLDELSHLTRLGTLGEITATISHELKQPLLAIGNYATGTLHRINEKGMDDQKLKEVFQLISELSLRARKIVHNTRNFATKKTLQPVQVSPRELLTKSLELIHTEFTRKDILLKNELSESSDKICVDLIQGQQVLVNLLLNAIQAIEKSTKKIQHSVTVRSTQVNPDLLQITISDTADGIKEETTDGVFDMFHTSNQSGLGMGLGISQKIVERHRGKLKVAHTGPDGTTFEILFPICKELDCNGLDNALLEPDIE